MENLKGENTSVQSEQTAQPEELEYVLLSRELSAIPPRLCQNWSAQPIQN